MSYQDKDESVEGSAPLLLYEFTTAGVTTRLTDRTTAVTATVAGTSRVWSPAVIVPDTFGRCNDVGKDKQTIKIAKDSALAASYLDYPPDAVTTVTIFRAFLDDSEAILYWKGRVGTTDADDEGLIFECMPDFSQLKRMGLRALYMSTCRHMLYDPVWCGLSRANFASAQTAFACTGNDVRINAFTARSGYWVGGSLMTAAGVERTILAHKIGQGGDIVTLSRPIRALTLAVAASNGAGVGVTLYRGCDHTYAACKARGNQGRFGGFPWRRNKNPFTLSIIT